MFCPTDDFVCPYYKDGYCFLEDAEQECDAFFGLEDGEDYFIESGFDPYLGCYTDDC